MVYSQRKILGFFPTILLEKRHNDKCRGVLPINVGLCLEDQFFFLFAHRCIDRESNPGHIFLSLPHSSATSAAQIQDVTVLNLESTVSKLMSAFL